MNKGVFWGVSVGPGDPELLTLAAQKAILRCPVLAVPRTKGEHMLALSIAQGAADLSDKEILPLDFLMTTDPKALTENHRHLAGLVAQKLDQGLDVAMLNLGDASIYATFSYLMELLAGDYEVKVIPEPASAHPPRRQGGDGGTADPAGPVCADEKRPAAPPGPGGSAPGRAL